MTDKKQHIMIIGAGAAGLMAANELLKKEYDVTVIEASDLLGGRIQTLRNKGFEQAVEKGVEFIHGNLPLTLDLVNQAGIDYKPVKGRMVRIENGEWKILDDFAVGWEELMEKMNEVEVDITMAEFLQQNFSGDKYKTLRESAIRFAEGFDVADTSKASVLALRAEWMDEPGPQYRVTGGFDQMINWMEKQCKTLGGLIYTSSKVEKITWDQDGVAVFTNNRKKFTGHKAIITVSLGLLQADPPPISFHPAIEDHLHAAKKIGFGSVVKILLQFKERFWEKKKSNLGFVLSQEKISTWWTQLPEDYCLLTGWVGGPQASELEKNDDETILELSLQSLSNIFEKPLSELKQLLTASYVANWCKDPFSKGAYSFDTLETKKAREVLNTPIDNVLFFAGEALYEGASPGTLEAALVNGKQVAEKIISGL
jgi:monoamine oxidase